MKPSTDYNRTIQLLDHSNSQAVLMDKALEQYSNICVGYGWNDVLLALDKARSALLDRMTTQDRAERMLHK